LNRGEFTKYQESRQKKTPPKEKTLEDQVLGEQVKRILESNRDSSNTEAMGKLGAYLSSPAHEHALSPFSTSKGLAEEGKPLDTVLNVLILLLRLFVLRS
jgi:hypothetical protein